MFWALGIIRTLSEVRMPLRGDNMDCHASGSSWVPTPRGFPSISLLSREGIHFLRTIRTQLPHSRQ